MTTTTPRFWAATHIITWTPAKGPIETWLVMYVPNGLGAEGVLYTESEWDETAESDWTMDSSGLVWFQGKESPGPGTTSFCPVPLPPMKIKPEHFEAIQTAIAETLLHHPGGAEQYKQAGLSDKRFRWDTLWASRFNGLQRARSWLSSNITYANDDDIDTALRKIFNHST